MLRWPILTRIDRGQGKDADTYAVQLPEHFQQLARELTWRNGEIHAVRPVVRVLGDVSALAYEAIERGHRSPTTADLTRTTGISRRAITDHLAGMEALGMIGRHHGRWETVATTNLAQLADRLGATEDREAQLTRYRTERAACRTPESVIRKSARAAPMPRQSSDLLRPQLHDEQRRRCVCSVRRTPVMVLSPGEPQGAAVVIPPRRRPHVAAKGTAKWGLRKEWH